MKSKNSLSIEKQKELLTLLKTRFEKNKERHKGLRWDAIEARLIATVEKLAALNEMEITGGEPDVVAFDKKTGEYIFFDCPPKSPAGRRSLCYGG